MELIDKSLSALGWVAELGLTELCPWLSEWQDWEWKTLECWHSVCPIAVWLRWHLIFLQVDIITIPLFPKQIWLPVYLLFRIPLHIYYYLTY